MFAARQIPRLAVSVPRTATLAPARYFTRPPAQPADLAEARSLPYLARPLGVPERPEPDADAERGLRERTKEFFSEERQEERKRAMLKEAHTGYFADLATIQKHGGKTWIAPPTLIQEQRALYFPDIKGTKLKDGKTQLHTAEMVQGKVSLVTVQSTTIGDEHVKSWSKPILSAHSSHPSFQYIQINSQPNPLKSFLLSLFFSSLRRDVPPALQDTYLFSAQSLEYLRPHLGMDNKYAGYAYVVDSEGRVRWAGGGFAEEGEWRAGERAVGVLLGRMGEGGGEGKA